jgi:hypothetical protein
LKTNIIERFNNWRASLDPQPDLPFFVNGVEMPYETVYDIAMKDPAAVLSIRQYEPTPSDIPAQFFIDEHDTHDSRLRFDKHVFWPLVICSYVLAFIISPLDKLYPGIDWPLFITFVLITFTWISLYINEEKKEKRFEEKYRGILPVPFSP